MAQNIYDDLTFFNGYSQLPRQRLGLAGAPEWPAIRTLLPALAGKHVVDLGCGFGWAARWIRQQGAATVLGIDLSSRMIDQARAETTDLTIAYRIADLETLNLPETTFGLAYSALTFHYIADFHRLMRVIYQSLIPGGDLVFTIEHPIFMAANHPHWIHDESGHKTWPVNHYADEGERQTDWFIRGVVKYHRTLATTINTLIETGFQLRRVVEFAPTHAQIKQAPELAEERERPMMLLISAHKPKE